MVPVLPAYLPDTKKISSTLLTKGGGGYPIPVKPHRPKQKILNRFTTLFHDPSNHTEKNIQSVYYSVRGITRDTLNRTVLPT
ncbi:hypothetical protein OUZ56_003919 [Daphnia magna]|uniref:Uncharacterized protein n=1 Tax=Daphnia magna TaxID=35525 RepID=A0ABQ9YN75_9CRUS|nr:hypothetical protein OUZ56_003919 [Daphnia magna]